MPISSISLTGCSTTPSPSGPVTFTLNHVVTKAGVRFRIDGVLHLVYELPDPVMTAVISRLKTLGRMDVAEKRRPQDGRLKTRMPDQHEVELRLATLPTAHGGKDGDADF